MKLLPKYQEIALPNHMRIENFLDINFHISKLTGSKLTRLRVCLFSFQCTPTRITDFGNVSDEKID